MSFFLKPWQTHQTLWYCRSLNRRDLQCRVDILVPCILRLHGLSPIHITIVDQLPVLPFYLTLLQTLQPWYHDIKTGAKEENCTRHLQNIEGMLSSRHVAMLKIERPWEDNGGGKKLFGTSSFRAATRPRVKLFYAYHPQFAEDWKLLGFDDSEVGLYLQVDL